MSASVAFCDRPFDKPLVLSSGAITMITEATATVRVSVGGREAIGRGSIYLSDLWAWPDPKLTHALRDAAMRQCCELFAADLPTLCGEPAHPLSLGLRLHEAAVARAFDDESSPQNPPPLARAVCASIFDAAIHDAAGRVLRCSALDFYRQPFPIPEADAWFSGVAGDCCDAVRELIDRAPRQSSPAWYVISGVNEDLSAELEPLIRRHGLFAFKLKTKGIDPEADARRTAEVARVARQCGVRNLRINVDSNEANADARSVLAYLDALHRMDANAYDAVEMLEQPTGRDLRRYAYDWRSVAARKAVFVDEGLLTFDAMQLAAEQGWSGFALKTCKGHSFLLAAAAWAWRRRMLLSLQDLTNPGLAAIHAGLLGARLPTTNGVELNSWQFTPAANEAWLPRLSCLFIPEGGVIRLPPADAIGLGSDL